MKDENKEKEILDAAILVSVVQIGMLRTLIQILSVIGWGFLFVILLLGSILVYLHFSWAAIAGTCLGGFRAESDEGLVITHYGQMICHEQLHFAPKLRTCALLICGRS